MIPAHSYFAGNLVHLVTLVVILPFAAWNLWTASQYGYVHGRFGNTTRADSRSSSGFLSALRRCVASRAPI